MSKAKRNGGYVLVDFEGIVTSNDKLDEDQTPKYPVFDVIAKAIENNKPILITNVSDGAGHYFSPIPTMFYKPFPVAIGGWSPAYTIGVTSEDGVETVVINTLN